MSRTSTSSILASSEHSESLSSEADGVTTQFFGFSWLSTGFCGDPDADPLNRLKS